METGSSLIAGVSFVILVSGKTLNVPRSDEDNSSFLFF